VSLVDESPGLKRPSKERVEPTRKSFMREINNVDKVVLPNIGDDKAFPKLG